MSYTGTPQMTPRPQGSNNPKRGWRHGLCSCCGDCGICLQTACCPCVTFGQNASRMGSSCLCCCIVYSIFCWAPCILGTTKRGDIRNRYNISGSTCGDCCVHCWLPCCALVQEARELNSS